MSNMVCVQFTKFQNLNDDGSSADDPNVGYRIYDDYSGDYNNCFDSAEKMIEKEFAPGETEGIFDYILENHESFGEKAINRNVMLNDIIPPAARRRGWNMHCKYGNDKFCAPQLFYLDVIVEENGI